LGAVDNLRGFKTIDKLGGASAKLFPYEVKSVRDRALGGKPARRGFAYGGNTKQKKRMPKLRQENGSAVHRVKTLQVRNNLAQGDGLF
jgi:hypothetical protein